MGQKIIMTKVINEEGTVICQGVENTPIFTDQILELLINLDYKIEESEYFEVPENKDKSIFTSFKAAGDEFFALGYFHDGTNDKYIDESIYTITATKEKEITDKDDIKSGVKDYKWRIEVFLK